MAEWWEEEGAVASPEEVQVMLQESVGDWWNQPGATEGQTAAEARFKVDPNLTPEYMENLPEMTHSSRMIEGFGVQGEDVADDSTLGKLAGMSRRMGTEFGQAWLQMTTSDPVELGMILENSFPGHIEVRVSPEGVPVAKNLKTGYEAVINKPGMSGMDVLQTIGLVGQFLPAAKATAIPKALAGRSMAGAATSGLTQHAAEKVQEASGGEYDPEDVALATAFGGAGEYIVPGLIGAGTKMKEWFGPLKDMPLMPESITQALAFAKAQGYKVLTSDALQERITPAMNIFLKVTERIPVFGTAGARIAQKANRADAMSQLAKRFGVDIETDLGEEIVKSWGERFRNWRWFGKNQKYAEPGAATPDMLARAMAKETAEVTDEIVKKRIADAAADPTLIDEQLVDIVLNKNFPGRAKELFRKLTPEGQQLMQSQFITNAMRRAGWKPKIQASIPDPKVLVKFLDDHDHVIRDIFPDVEDRAFVDGVREFIRITDAAGNIGEGAGMTAAMGAGSALYLFDVLGGAIAGAMTGRVGAAMQSRAARALFLRLRYAKGNPELTRAIMNELRPLVLGAGNQYLQEGADMPNVTLTPERVPGLDTGAAAQSGMSALRQIAGASMEAISPMGMVTAGADAMPPRSSLLTGPGVESLQTPPGALEEVVQPQP